MSDFYTDAENCEITRRWTAGDSLVAISLSIGRTKKAVGLQRWKLGLPPRGNKIKLTGIQAEKLRYFCNTGATYREIEKGLGISKCAIQRLIRDMGFQKLGYVIGRRIKEPDKPTPRLRKDCIASQMVRLTDKFTARTGRIA